jgi:RNA polymerase sigma-70 factor (ECF subfamily)
LATRDSRYPHIGDRALVLAALLGEMGAFDELVRRFRGAVTLIAEQTLGSWEAAEDVAQEVFLLAFKALPQLQDPDRFPGWLCAIARRRALRAAGQQRRSVPTEMSKLDRLIVAHSREFDPNPAEEAARRTERERLRAALADLPPEYQTVIHLHHYEDWPVARIAEFLSLPSTTVKWRLHQGRKLLCRQLAESTKEKTDG